MKTCGWEVPWQDLFVYKKYNDYINKEMPTHESKFENYKDTAIRHLFSVFSLVTFLQIVQLLEALRQLKMPELQ